MELRLEQHHTGTNRLSAVAPSIRIGSGGDLHVTHKTHTFKVGWADGDLLVLWLAQQGPIKGPFTLRWGGYTKTFQFWEPLISKPMLGAGEPRSGPRRHLRAAALLGSAAVRAVGALGPRQTSEQLSQLLELLGAVTLLEERPDLADV